MSVNDLVESIVASASLSLSFASLSLLSLFLSLSASLSSFKSLSLCLVILCRLLHSPSLALLLLNDDRHVPCSPFARCRYQTLLFSFFQSFAIYRFLLFTGVRAAFVSTLDPLPSSPFVSNCFVLSRQNLPSPRGIDARIVVGNRERERWCYRFAIVDPRSIQRYLLLASSE